MSDVYKFYDGCTGLQGSRDRVCMGLSFVFRQELGEQGDAGVIVDWCAWVCECIVSKLLCRNSTYTNELPTIL